MRATGGMQPTFSWAAPWAARSTPTCGAEKNQALFASRRKARVVKPANMQAEQLIEQGDFKGALDVLRQTTSGANVDPGQLLMRFGLEVRVQEFDAAAATMDRLCTAAPDVAPQIRPLGLAAQAERVAIERLSNPTLAGKRSTVGMPPPHAVALIKVAVIHAQGDKEGAKAALAEAKGLTPATSGTVVRKNGSTFRFTNVVDSDELTLSTLPVYEGAQVLDLAYTEIRSIQFLEPKTSYDVMWPRAEIMMVTGELLRVRVPALYPGSGIADESFVRTGQMTTWSYDRGYAEGHGQRDLKFTTADGNPVVGLLGIASITFDNPMRAAAGAGGQTLRSAEQEQPWTNQQTAAAWAAGILGGLLMLRPGILIGFDEGYRIKAILIGCIVSGLVGWVAAQRASKAAAVLAVVMAFVATTLRWIL